MRVTGTRPFEPGLRPPEVGGDALVERLRRLGAAIAPHLDASLLGGEGALGVAKASACARFSLREAGWTSREVLGSPSMTVVFTGRRQARRRGTMVRAGAGELLLLPAGGPVELACVAEGPTCRSQALEVALFPDAFSRWVPDELGVAPASPAEASLVRLGPAALTALVHFCEAVLDPVVPARMLEHELEGVLLALMLDVVGDAPAMSASAAAGLDLAVRRIVREGPEARWRLCEMARKLGVSEATLRRRLSSHGTGLRQIVHEERMRVATSLLAEGSLNVTEVAFRCGYDSPAKFSQQFKRSIGVLPSAYRHGSLPPPRADRARN